MEQLPDMNSLLKLARSPAGQKLLAMLQSNCSRSELDTISADAAAGNIQEASRKISGILASEEAKELLKQLEKQL